MQNKGKLLNNTVRGFNRLVGSLRDSRLFGDFVKRYITVVTYTGRRSGRTFSVLVGFRRDGNTVTIPVAMPDAKSWWRNFLDEPRPLSVEFEGEVRTGQATARRTGRDAVSVTILLDDHVAADPHIP